MSATITRPRPEERRCGVCEHPERWHAAVGRPLLGEPVAAAAPCTSFGCRCARFVPEVA